MAQKKLQSSKGAVTGFKDSRSDTTSYLEIEPTRKKPVLMMAGKTSRKSTEFCGKPEKHKEEETHPLQLTQSMGDGYLKIDTTLTRFLSHL